MKNFLILTTLFFISVSCQKEYYTLNSGNLYTEKELKSIFEKASATLPDNYYIIPRIYHRIESNDTTVNFVSFIAQKNDSSDIQNKFEFEISQDSLFLLLNKKLPEFSLKDLNGNEYSSTQLIGKPTLLNYWAISCPPCIAEIPELNGLKEKYGDKMNFVALTENTCQDDDLKKFIEKHPFNFLILQDAEFYKMEINIGAIPRNIFLDKEGYVRYIQSNFPYTAFDPQNGIKKYEENNYFVKIIEELIGKQ